MIIPWQQPTIMRGVTWALLSRWATYLFVLLMPFSVFWPIETPLTGGVLPLYVTPGIHLSDLALVVMLLISLFTVRRWGPFELSGPLVGLGLLVLITAPWAIIPRLAGYMALRWLIAFAVYLWFVQKMVPVERMVQWFVAGLCLHVAVALAQVIVQHPLGLPGELALPLSAKWVSVVSLPGSRWLRAYGLTFHPNVLGGYLAVGLLLSMPLLYRWSMRCAWWLLWLGLFITFSRSAWVGAMLTVPVVTAWIAWRYPQQRRTLAIASFGAGVVLLSCSLIWPQQLAVRLQPITKRMVFMSKDEVKIAIGLPTATPSPLPSPTASHTALVLTSTPMIATAPEIATTLPSEGKTATPRLSNTPTAVPATATATAPLPTSTATAVPATPTTVASPAVSPTPTVLTAIAASSKPNTAELWSVHWRHEVTSRAIGVIKERPLQGVGAGNSVLVMPYNFSPTHQVPLMLASEAGILGGGLWLSLWLTVTLLLIRSWRQSNSWLIVGVCAWLALAVIGLFDFYPWGLNSGRLLTVMVSGLIARSWEVT